MTRLEHYNQTSHDKFETNLSWSKAATMAKYQREWLLDDDVMINIYRCIICSAYITESEDEDA